jgi:hypothetical protein
VIFKVVNSSGIIRFGKVGIVVFENVILGLENGVFDFNLSFCWEEGDFSIKVQYIVFTMLLIERKKNHLS